MDRKHGQDVEIFQTPDPDPAEDEKKQQQQQLQQLQQQQLDAKSKEDIIEMPLRPQLAFEQFAGKLYDFRSAEFVDKTKIYTISAQAGEYAAWPKSQRALETPLQRYQRLKDEIIQFQSDLETVVKQTSGNGVIGSISSALSKEVVSLDRNLELVHKNPQYQPYFNPDVSDAATLEQKGLVDKLLAQLQGKGTDEKGMPLPAPTPSNAKALQDRITYELYYNPLKDKGRYELHITDLDKRLAALEKTLGTFDETKSMGYPDVHTALQNLQRRMEFLDNTKLEAIYRKVKQLMGELEALIKMKNTAQGDAASPHQEKIAQIYELMMKWDQAARQLPAVIARLQSLKDVHDESAAVVLRAQSYESEQSKAVSLLKQDQEALELMSKSLNKNMEIMQKNVQALESRFGTLQEKMKKLK